MLGSSSLQVRIVRDNFCRTEIGRAWLQNDNYECNDYNKEYKVQWDHVNVIGKVGRVIRARLEIDHPSVPKRSKSTVIASVLNFSVVQSICGCCFQNFRIQLQRRILTQTCISENNGDEFQMKKRELCPKNTLLSPPWPLFRPTDLVSNGVDLSGGARAARCRTV